MFTGIIQETGTVKAIVAGDKLIRLELQAGPVSVGLKIGDSMAVNGCCLTVTRLMRRGGTAVLRFDLLRETWNCTNLRFTRPGALVNLERPVRAGETMDGHYVTGHVDGVGTVSAWERVGTDYLLDISAAAGLMRYIVSKGSITVDGISLTVARVVAGQFRVWIIPHTYEVTALRERKVGDAVNLETDILGKYIERFMNGAAAAMGTPVQKKARKKAKRRSG